MMNVSNNSSGKPAPRHTITPFDDPNSSLLKERFERRHDPREVVEDVWDDVTEKMMEELMGEELARAERAGEESVATQDDDEPLPEALSKAAHKDAKGGMRTQGSDRDKDWQPRRANYRGQEWNIV